jgi:hypothetical protein
MPKVAVRRPLCKLKLSNHLRLLTRKKSILSRERLQFVEPMYARAVQQLPEGKDWLYEVKFEGYRCLAGRDSNGVTLWSRRGNRFSDQFPTVAEACEHLPPHTLLDGELIALDKDGRISFNILQHHRSQAQATLLYAFDVIIHRGRRLIHVPLETRRELLSDSTADLKTRTPLIGLSETLDTPPAELTPLVKEFGFDRLPKEGGLSPRSEGGVNSTEALGSIKARDIATIKRRRVSRTVALFRRFAMIPSPKPCVAL